MKANKMRTSKIKIAVVIGLLCCMAFGMSVMALDEYYPYTVGPNETLTIDYVPQESTIHIDTRPGAGGDVTITVGNASVAFPYYTSRPDWVVTVPNPSETLTITVRAGSRGASGVLHVRS